MRFVLGVCAVVLAASTLSACATQSEYCASIEENRDTLASLGRIKTEAAFDGYVKQLRQIAGVAPKKVRADWSTLADVTEGFLQAHRDVKFPMADRNDPAKVKKLSKKEVKKINDAAIAFNNTFGEQRNRVYRNVEQECGIKLISSKS